MSVAESEARPRVNSRHAQCGYAYRRRAGEATPTAAPRYHDNSTHHTATISHLDQHVHLCSNSMKN